MKQYFIDGIFYNPKNKAHREAQNFAVQFHHCLIDELKLHDLMTAIDNKIWWINRENKRCNDIKLIVSIPFGNMQENQIIGIEGNFQLNIMPVIRYELSPETGRDPAYDLMGDMKYH
jgi:hypothetical protein